MVFYVSLWYRHNSLSKQMALPRHLHRDNHETTSQEISIAIEQRSKIHRVRKKCYLYFNLFKSSSFAEMMELIGTLEVKTDAKWYTKLLKPDTRGYVLRYQSLWTCACPTGVDFFQMVSNFLMIKTVFSLFLGRFSPGIETRS